MRLTFIVPARFTIHGVLAKERVPCLVELEVIRLRRQLPRQKTRFLRRWVSSTLYFASVRLPEWIIAPDAWIRDAQGFVCLQVPLQLNRRWDRPEFPAGVDRIEFADAYEAKL